MALVLQRVVNARDRRRFVDLPRRLLGARPSFVPPMTAEECALLDPRRNPFFAHAQAAFFLLLEDGVPVGRISAVDDELARSFHGRPEGVFGHVLARGPEETALLIDAAARWCRQRGLGSMLGPIELSTNYTCGLQVSGFDRRPMVDMNQHPEGMGSWLERAGLRAVKDLLAFRLTRRDLKTEVLERVRRAAEGRFPAAVRALDDRHFPSEVRTLHRIYMRAWERNFGFVPMSEDEFAAIARRMRRIYDPGLCLVAERDGEAVGFILGLPDANEGIAACGGRLLPLGWLKFLRAMRRCRRMRVLTLGLVPEARGKGLDARLILELVRAGLERHIEETELSWVLEDNVPMVKPILRLGARESARYRLYRMELPPRRTPAGRAVTATRSPSR